MILKYPAHHIPNQTEIATEEFRPKRVLQKLYEVDYVKSYLSNALNKKDLVIGFKKICTSTWCITLRVQLLLSFTECTNVTGLT